MLSSDLMLPENQIARWRRLTRDRRDTRGARATRWAWGAGEAMSVRLGGDGRTARHSSRTGCCSHEHEVYSSFEARVALCVGEVASGGEARGECLRSSFHFHLVSIRGSGMEDVRSVGHSPPPRVWPPKKADSLTDPTALVRLRPDAPRPRCAHYLAVQPLPRPRRDDASGRMLGRG